MGKIALGIVLTLMVLGLLPFALIARSRASQSPALPPHLVLDMDKQPKFKPQRGTPLFADERSMRPAVPHTLALEDMGIHSEVLNDIQQPRLMLDFGGKEALEFANPTEMASVTLGRIRPAAMTDEQFDAVAPPKGTDEAIAADATFYVKKIPAQFTVNAEFLQRGQERFNIYCAPCHGEDGYGKGPVAQRAAQLRLTPQAIAGWADPQNLNEAKILARPDGHIFNTITHGIRNMPAYESQITIADRWAIISYVRALELSQNAPPTP